MSVKHFIQEIERGLKSTAYFLYAEDYFLLKEASIMSARTIPESERDFCFDAFDIEDSNGIQSFKQILDVANTIPFLGKRRIVVIENIHGLSKSDTGLLEGYISNPSPHCVLVLLHKGSIKNQFKEIAKRAKAISLDMRQQDIPLWIKEKARHKGIEVTDKAIEYLVDMVGYDVGLISSELEKFTLVGKSRIDVTDIVEVVRGSNDYGVFDLVDALKKRDVGKVFKIARTLQETTEPYGLTGAINWHYSRMALNDKGSNRDYYDKVFSLLNDADIHIKTSGGTFPIEYLLIRLLQV